MFRTALLRSVRGLATSATRSAGPVIRPIRPVSSASVARLAPITRFQAVRCYSAHAGLAREEVEGRIMDVLKNFDKVNDASKISPKSHFANDLGLDSLDTVEVVMAIEEVSSTCPSKSGIGLTKWQEFSIEIPDKEADAIHSSTLIYRRED
ncbi:MAG: hypothetical protein M1817_004224 [Caeruleum heppii]|nr:MAG: hypothetical protein M1817_004224 [Caeruleum heppii]